MTHTPSYGIWTTDLNGFRVAGFTPAQMLAVTQQRDELLAALANLLNDTQHAEHPDCDDGPCPVREARAAIQKANNKEQA